jgi:putative FmdB family regulatory protein
MPTYEYNCKKCGPFEHFQKITEDALKTCPQCGGEVERLISASAFHLKGGGWYKTDYASGKSVGGDSSTKPVSKESNTSSETSAPKTETPKTETPPPAPSTPTTSQS